MKKPTRHCIIFSGGGTLGPVTPLLAIHETLIGVFEEGYEPHWFGTRKGVERALVAEYGIPYTKLTAGKLRRYMSFWNILDLAKLVIGFFQSVGLLLKYNPELCISAGGYVSVPLHWAAWFLGIPTWIHQQDVQVSLANRLMKVPASRITTVLEAQVPLFPKKKTSWLGNPIREEIISGSQARAAQLFNLTPGLPVVLVTGGGTGSQRLNHLIAEAVPALEGFCQIIHLTGKERSQEMALRAQNIFGKYYHVQDFLTSEMKDVYAAATLVICRGGFGTLSELAALKKAAVVVPKPGHQEENVKFFADKGAIRFVDETRADGNFMARLIKELLANREERTELARNLHALLPPTEPERIAEIVEDILKK